MKRFSVTPKWCPTVQQELLLRAALAEGEDVLSSWRKWQSSVDLSGIDRGSVRLLPLLFHNLKLHGVPESAIANFKEEYVQTWCDNELFFQKMAVVLGSFQAVGIEAILLKGAALALQFYGDSGLRPMNDVDILVRPEKARLAIRQLHQTGWKSAYETPDALIPYQHAIAFINGQGQTLDLHWRVLWEGRQEITDDDLWETATPIQINNVLTSILSPTDQLLHVCVHGTASNDSSPLRWVADAAVILKMKGDEIKWDRLIEQTKKRRLMLQMTDTLGYLQKFLGEVVPAGVIQTMQGISTCRSERIVYQLRIGPNMTLRKLPTLYHWLNTWRVSNNSPFRHKLPEFSRYLKCFLSVRLSGKRLSKSF
jgi:putative nucleotidyltransferase-like protein